MQKTVEFFTKLPGRVGLLLRLAYSIDEGKRREARAEDLIGQRVWIPARNEVRMLGRVTKFKMQEDTNYYPKYKIEYRAELTVQIDALHDGDNGPRTDGLPVQCSTRCSLHW